MYMRMPADIAAPRRAGRSLRRAFMDARILPITLRWPIAESIKTKSINRFYARPVSNPLPCEKNAVPLR